MSTGQLVEFAALSKLPGRVAVENTQGIDLATWW